VLAEHGTLDDDRPSRTLHVLRWEYGLKRLWRTRPRWVSWKVQVPVNLNDDEQLKAVSEWLGQYVDDTEIFVPFGWDHSYIVPLLRLLSTSCRQRPDEPEYPWMISGVDDGDDDDGPRVLTEDLVYPTAYLHALEFALSAIQTACQEARRVIDSRDRCLPPLNPDVGEEPF
jgi:hypothetical protein